MYAKLYLSVRDVRRERFPSIVVSVPLYNFEFAMTTDYAVLRRCL